MAEFKDIFGCQLIGAAISEKFSGSLRLAIGYETAVVWFDEGQVSGITYDAFTGFDALVILAFASEGDVLAKPGPSPKGDAGYLDMMDEIVGRAQPPMPDRCPMMQYANFAVFGSSFPQSQHRGMGYRIAAEAKRHQSLSKISEQFDSEPFWKAFFYLTANGLAAIDYFAPVGSVLAQLQNQIGESLQKNVGAESGSAYLVSLHSQLKNHWPNLPQGQRPMSSEGIVPYRAWAAALRSGVENIGSTVQGTRCFRQAIDDLPEYQALMVRRLLN